MFWHEFSLLRDTGEGGGSTGTTDYKDELLDQVSQTDIDMADVRREHEIGALVTQANTIIEGARAEERDLTDEENGKADELINRAEMLKYAVPIAKRRQWATKTQESLADSMDVPQKLEAGWRADASLDKVDAWETRTEDQYLNEVAKWEAELIEGARADMSAPGIDQVEHRRMELYGAMLKDEMRAAQGRVEFRIDEVTQAALGVVRPDTTDEGVALDSGMRTLGTGSTPGSVLLPPPVHDAGIKAFLNQDNWLRQRATGRRLPRNRELRIRIETNSTSFTWGGDTSVASAADPALQLMTLGALSATRRINFTNEILRVSEIDLLAELRMICGRDASITLENAYFTGTGTHISNGTEPYGVLSTSPPSGSGAVAPAVNVGVLRVGQDHAIADWSNFLTASTPTLDQFVDAPYGIPSQYSRRGVWFMHRGVWKDLVDLRSNQYMLVNQRQQGLPAGAVGDIATKPVFLSESCPSTPAAGVNFAAFFDPTQYYYVDEVPLIGFSVLREVSALSRTIVVLAVYVGDAKPGLSSAFARVKATAL